MPIKVIWKVLLTSPILSIPFKRATWNYFSVASDYYSVFSNLFNTYFWDKNLNWILLVYLPIDFISESLISMAEPAEDAVPFVPRSQAN